MLPFEQGGLDSLCGLYSLVNAERMINNTSIEGSQELFNALVRYLDKRNLLVSILIGGMLLKHIRAMLVNVIGDRIPYQRLHFAGVPNPGLGAFWGEMESFLAGGERRAVLLSMSGVYDHWTVVRGITARQIGLLDSYHLCFLNRVNCTTARPHGRRHHGMYPAQTYFLGRS